MIGEALLLWGKLRVAGHFGRGYAVVIGVANYRNVPVLPGAVLDDARDVAEVLTSEAHCGYERSDVRLMLDGEATLGAIREALAGLAEEAGADDAVVVFFSGHGARVDSAGGGESVLLPVECDPGALGSTCLLEAELSRALNRMRCGRLLVLLDACHAGGAGALKGASGEGAAALGYHEKSLARWAQGTGRVLIASCRASEVACVLPGARNSVFTTHLLGALRGEAWTSGDSVIRVFEVFNHVSEAVRRELPGRQHPIFKASDLEDNFAVAWYRGGVKARGAVPAVGGAGAFWSKLGETMSVLYPAGPMDQEVWLRAGGDPSRLHWNVSGREAWLRALGAARRGGGGSDFRAARLVAAALEDYPHHQVLRTLL